ncbi:MAG: hypothetical protein IPL46_01710 [Saprospiraceae bacterium]|nr:hypothetical protein [Saprospiraceae bacterium]
MANTIGNYLNPKESIIIPSAVTLFEKVRPGLQTFIAMRIREDGALEVAGRDAGRLVVVLQGKSEYEYFLLVDVDQKDLLKKKLQIENADIRSDADRLDWFQLYYSKNEAFSEISELLKKLEIKCDVSFL